MNVACIPHSDIPGASRLFLDYLARFDRVEEFYSCPPQLSQAHEKAKNIELPDATRAELVATLRRINQGARPETLSNLELLAQPGTVAVVTGQQTGLYGGPSFSLYKALTAAKYAAVLRDEGLPAVPVFWLATEDHDLAEIDHVRFLDASDATRKMTAQSAGHPNQPVGGVPITDAQTEELRVAFAGLDWAEEALTTAEAAYASGTAYGESFARLFSTLLEPYGLILLDPMDAGIRRLAAPLMRRAIERHDELSAALRERSATLEAAGYHAQVHLGADTALVFRIADGKRTALKHDQDGFHKGAETFTASQLIEALDSDPEGFSPNALLRPVVQDWLLPTAAFVGGPAELAYLAQSEVLYDRLLGRCPVILPRASFTLVDERTRRLLDRYGLSVTDCLTPAATLRDLIAKKLAPPEVQSEIAATRMRIDRALEGLDGVVSGFDESLGTSLATSRRKVMFQIDKLGRKVEREALRRDGQAERDAKRLTSWIYPEKAPQERHYGGLGFAARFGGDQLAKTVYEAIHPECVDHQVLAL